MSNIVIKFIYNQIEYTVECSRNEKMKVIFERFGTKAHTAVENLEFIYGGDIINPELTLDQVNKTDEEIKIIVILNDMEKDPEEKKEKSTYIKGVQSDEPAIVEFSTNYEIILDDLKNTKKKIKPQEYDDTQMVDQYKIKCSCCSKPRAEAFNGQFYFCYECQNNLCPLCLSRHQEHKNIVDFTIKHYQCSKHQGQIFIAFCNDCKKNLCFFCKNEHKNHNTTLFKDLYQDQNIQLNEKVEKLKKEFEVIIDTLRKLMEYYETCAKISETLNENFVKMNINYQNLKSYKNLKENEVLNKDLDQILNTKDLNKKLRKIMSMYGHMSGITTNATNFKNNPEITQITQARFQINNKKSKKITLKVSNQAKLQINNGKSNEIVLKVNVEQNEVNKQIYFLDSNECLVRNGHDHGCLKEMYKTNTSLIIDGKILPFNNSFIPKRRGIYTIKLLFKRKLVNCENMFCSCKNIIGIDFSNFKSENVVSMKSMFYGCSSLGLLDLHSFNTEKVTNMQGMFNGCAYLKTLDLSSFNTKNVTDMSYMFGESTVGCASLRSLDLSSFNTKKVTNMASMFNRCSSLLTLNLSSFNTENVVSMRKMFNCCSSLQTLNVKSFNTSNVTDMNGMLCRCSSLKSLDLSSFNTLKVTDMSFMFGEKEGGCSSLLNIDLSSFNTENVTNMCDMFGNCSALTEMNLSRFNTKKVTDMRFMFYGCSSLKKINLSKFNASKAETVSMFDECKDLITCITDDRKIKKELKEKKVTGDWLLYKG